MVAPTAIGLLESKVLTSVGPPLLSSVDLEHDGVAGEARRGAARGRAMER